MRFYPLCPGYPGIPVVYGKSAVEKLEKPYGTCAGGAHSIAG